MCNSLKMIKKFRINDNFNYSPRFFYIPRFIRIAKEKVSIRQSREEVKFFYLFKN